MRKWKTSESDPLRIDEIQLEGCKIGISFCPGKVQEFAMSGSWDRDLDADLDVIASSGYNVVLSLIEYREFEELQVEGFLESAVQNNGMEWIWAPIRDGETPTPSNHSALGRALDAIKQDKSVFIHCKGGRGRAGSVAAWLLSHFGRTGLESIKEVRSIRKGAIENDRQSQWVRDHAGKEFGYEHTLLALNVNHTRPGSIRFQGLCHLFKSIRPSFLVLTECREDAFNFFCKELNAKDRIHAPADYWGNGIISLHHEFEESDCLDLPSNREHRSAALAVIDVSSNQRLRLIGAHLEVGSEEERIFQIDHLHDVADLWCSVLTGDLNSLLRSDYDGHHLERVLAKRDIAGKEPPEWEVMDDLVSNFSMIDAASFGNSRSTTPHFTRVDYLLFGTESGFVPVMDSYDVVDCLTNKLTDHNAVFTAFQLDGSAL
jgi:endonuclease/exonuclease/phosphatase family metal-dependent hydrolase/protein tyrosine phosphatase (PTP) superfamily phosphohydrolase (DUF442 family)